VRNANNQGSIALTKHSAFHDQSKHIDIQYHYTCDLVGEKKIQLGHIPTNEMLADLLMKSLLGLALNTRFCPD